MKPILFMTALLLSALLCHSQQRIYATAAGGNWNSTATWAGGVIPGAADTADIVSGSTVTLNNTSATSVGALAVAGTLNYTATAGVLTVNGAVTVAAGGNLEVCNGATGRSLVVKGNLVNNGTMELSKAGTVLTMGQAGTATVISGSGTMGVIRQLTIDNANGVTLAATTRISQTLRLQQGVLYNGAWLYIDNLTVGNGTASSQCFIQRSQASQLDTVYSLGVAAALYLSYFHNTALTAQSITEGAEIPSSRTLYRLTINNASGLQINDDLTLRSTVTALELTAGIITVASGKTLICNQVNNTNTTGAATSFVNGGIAMAVGTAAITRIFPVGSGGQKRAVTLDGLASTGGTTLVRFAIEAAAGNTAGAGVRSIKGVRRWKGSLQSGTGVTFTEMSIEYGTDDSLSSAAASERVIAGSTAIAGPYASLGSGTSTATVVSVSGSYNTLGYYALGMRSLPMKIYATATGGNWSSAASWTGGVIPVASDTAVIIAGSTITVNNTSGTPVGRLELAGTLGFTATAAALSVEGDVVVSSGGVLNAYNGSTGRQLLVKGDLVNNGTIDLSKSGSSLSMAEAGRATAISGTGSFGVFRQLVISNAAGVSLSTPVSVSNTLILENGALNNGTQLTIDNTTTGGGPSSSQCIIQRSQAGQLQASFTLPAAAALYVTYAENSALPAQAITEGYEIPASRSLFKLTVNNAPGVVLNDDLTLRSSVSALALTAGIVSLPAGKTITCTSTSNSNAAGTATSFVSGGGVAMAVGTTAAARIFPVGSKGQNRKVTLNGLAAATGTLLVRVAVTDSSAGTAGSGLTGLSPVRRWETSVVSGSFGGCTGVSIDYGTDDSLGRAAISEYRVARAAILSGTYNGLGAGTNTGTTVTTPAGTYTITGWLALGMEVPPATCYYIATSGNDTAAGTTAATAWQTLAKVNNRVFNSGDTIRFKRGDTWYGTLLITTPGLTIDAYGAGANPVISGNEAITATWTPVSGQIWSVNLGSGKPAAIRQLSRNGVVLPLSRYPNKGVNNGYLNFESHVSNTQFTDTDLPASPDWTGAEVVVRAYKWRLVRTTVSAHSGNTITIPASGDINLTDGFGYFFVNNLKAIDEEGEWAYDSNTGIVYLYAAADPNTVPVSFARYDTLVNITGAGYVTLKHLSLRNAGRLALLVRNTTQCVIDSTEVLDSGGDGVVLNNATYTRFSHNEVRRVNWSGLYSTTSSAYPVLEHNLFHTIGNEAFGKSKTFIGIDCNAPNAQILYNTVTGTGYTGILSAGVNNLIRRNRVDSICVMLEDNGGIYTNNNINNTTGTIIEENIVTNSIGELIGAPGKCLANGIYLDNLSQGVTVRHNTVGWVKGSGLFIHDTQKDVVLHDNTSFASGQRSELVLTGPHVAPAYVIRRNILVTADTAAAHDVVTSETQNYTYAQIGSFDSNYVVNPFRSKVATIYAQEATSRFTVAEWQTAMPQVTATFESPVSYTASADTAGKIRLYYNSTTGTQTWPLPAGLYVDAASQEYCGTVTVAPYRSVVLFLKDSAGCSSLPALRMVQAKKAEADTAVMVYPNPSASGAFTVRTNNRWQGALQLQVFETGGRLVWEKQRPADSTLHEVNLAGRSKGMYLLRISVNGHAAGTYKLIMR